MVASEKKKGASAATLTPTMKQLLLLGSLLDNGSARTACSGRLRHVPSGDSAPGVGSGALRHRHHFAVHHGDPFLVGAVTLVATFYATLRLLAHTFGTGVRHTVDSSHIGSSAIDAEAVAS